MKTLIRVRRQVPAFGDSERRRYTDSNLPRRAQLSFTPNTKTPPASRLPERTPQPKSELAKGAVLRPWLVAICGPRDGYVLYWLLRVWGPRANSYERTCWCRLKGEHCLAIQTKALADELGLEVQQVHRALKSLRQRGLITTKPYYVRKWRGTIRGNDERWRIQNVFVALEAAYTLTAGSRMTP